MGIILGRFEMPTKLVKDESTATDTYGKFTAEPFERGFGNTIGTSLRRLLLSSIEGAAVTSVKMDGVMHEFSTIPGVVEDVAELILNIKQIKLKMHTREPKKIMLKIEKKGEVKASDIIVDSMVEVVNPDLHIATIDKKAKLEIEMDVKIGRGYRPSEENKTNNMPVGHIPIDSIFSPVIRVNYAIQNTRVGQKTDYDKLIVEIWTDGRISPEDALTQSSAVLKEHLDIFVNYGQEEIVFEAEEQKPQEENRLKKLLATSIDEIELSVRSNNCIKSADIDTIGNLVRRSEPEMLKYRNFGKKSLNEIKKVLDSLGLSLGMNVDELLKEEKNKEE